ncbi:hypothetical protein ACLKA6_011097 [Drosophila palustris]
MSNWGAKPSLLDSRRLLESRLLDSEGIILSSVDTCSFASLLLCFFDTLLLCSFAGRAPALNQQSECHSTLFFSFYCINFNDNNK